MVSEPQFSGTRRPSVVPVLFALTVFAGAALLFLLEPYVGKSLLPMFGGAPAVWITCVFFFQFMLLIAYFYVFLIDRYLSIRGQLLIHSLAIAAAVATFPLQFTGVAAERVSHRPVASLVGVLALSAGLPFLVVSATAPLTQVWYSRWRRQGDPYWLYVASNSGSLAALVAYPLIIEDWLPLPRQSAYWTFGFLGLACLSLVCGVYALTSGTGPAASDNRATMWAPAVTPQLRFRWLLCSWCASSLMLGVTTCLSSEIAPIPVLWVLPLAAYLISFMIAFANPPTRLIRVCEIGYVACALLLAAFQTLLDRSDLAGIAFHLTLLLLGATALHAQVARTRPAPARLAEFYLWIALGGVGGGIFNSLLAPVLFNWLAEYPVAIVLGLLLIPWPSSSLPRHAWTMRAVRVGVAALVLVGTCWKVYFSESSAHVIYRERTFFGPFSIVRGTRGFSHQLAHGTTNHGIQNVGGNDPRARRAPLTYYYWSGPAGQLFIAHRGTDVSRSVGVVGLGIGSLASYGDPGQEFTFYEIDPAIERVARNPQWFTFLDDAEARGVKVHVDVGDARLRLHDAPDRAYGVLVLDAFTSDAIPMHLLTKEAVALYLAKLRPDGLLAFHISNLYVDLEPALANIAAELGLVAYIQVDNQLSEEEQRLGKSPSTWLVMAPQIENLSLLTTNGRWRPCRPQPEFGVWTDDRSNLLRAMRW